VSEGEYEDLQQLAHLKHEDKYRDHLYCEVDIVKVFFKEYGVSESLQEFLLYFRFKMVDIFFSRKEGHPSLSVASIDQSTWGYNLIFHTII
jgi:hypothetical protein